MTISGIYNVGLPAWLMSIHEPSQIGTHPRRGALFENWVVVEVLKARLNRGLPPNLYFWRDQSGNEVDLLLETAAQLLPVEIKAGQTVNSDFFKALAYWVGLARPPQPRAWLVYGGAEAHTHHETRVLSWRNLSELNDANR